MDINIDTNKKTTIKFKSWFVFRAAPGMTLVEIVISMALISIVLAVAAQALGGFVIGMEMHRENTLGIQSCRSVMGEIREKRAEFSGNFPSGLVQWISQQNEEGWEEYVLLEHAEGKLNEHVLTVQVTDSEGNPVGNDTNPIRVQVTANWTGMQGRERDAVLTTMLTDR